MKQLITAGFVALALVATACGGSTDTEASATTSGAVAADTDREALQLIAKLGSDDAATDALIIAMDRGYSGPQILAAVEARKLSRDGTIEGQAPADPALDLVLYELDGEGEGALGVHDGRARGTTVVLVSFFQVERTPIERLRAHATDELGIGEPATVRILLLLKEGFLPADIIEMFIFGVDGIGDIPNDPTGRDLCYKVVDELYCPDGERFPAPTEPDPSDNQVAAPAAPAPAPEVVDAQPMQLLWEGEMTPNPTYVESPIAGSYELTRTAGTDEFHMLLTTIDSKSGTFTTDGFDSVECATEWTSTFEGTGTFWDFNDLGIEFQGQVTNSRVYTSGVCEGESSDTYDFSGVVVSITPDRIESGFNAWTFAVAGPPPVPVGK